MNKKNLHINQEDKKPYPEPDVPVDFAWQEMKRILNEGNVNSKPINPSPINGLGIKYWKPGLFLFFLLACFCYYLIKENGKSVPISKEEFKTTTEGKNNLKQKVVVSPKTAKMYSKDSAVIIDKNKVPIVSAVKDENIDKERTGTSKNQSQFDFDNIENKIYVTTDRISQNKELKKGNKKVDKLEQVSGIDDVSGINKKAAGKELGIIDSGNLSLKEVKHSLIDKSFTNNVLNKKEYAGNANHTINKRKTVSINNVAVNKVLFIKLSTRKFGLNNNLKKFNKQPNKILLESEQELNKNKLAHSQNLDWIKNGKERDDTTEINYSALKDTFSNDKLQNSSSINSKDSDLMGKVKVDKKPGSKENGSAIINKYNFSPYLIYVPAIIADTNFLNTKKNEMVGFAKKVNLLNEIKSKKNKSNKNTIANGIEIGVQWNLPLAQSANYFTGKNGNSQPYQLVIPSIYLSKQLKKNKISLQVAIAEQNYLGMRLIASETYTRTPVDTTVISRNTYVLKTFGFGLGLQYVFSLSPSFNLGVGIGYHNQNAVLVNSKETLLNGGILTDSTSGFKKGASNYPHIASSFIDTKIELSYVNKRFNIGFLLQKPISNLIDSSSYSVKPFNAQFFIRYMIKRKK